MGVVRIIVHRQYPPLKSCGVLLHLPSQNWIGVISLYHKYKIGVFQDFNLLQADKNLSPNFHSKISVKQAHQMFPLVKIL